MPNKHHGFIFMSSLSTELLLCAENCCNGLFLCAPVWISLTFFFNSLVFTKPNQVSEKSIVVNANKDRKISLYKRVYMYTCKPFGRKCKTNRWHQVIIAHLFMRTQPTHAFTVDLCVHWFDPRIKQQWGYLVIFGVCWGWQKLLQKDNASTRPLDIGDWKIPR